MSVQVALSHRCLDTLAEWTRWGILDRQTTILRLLQGVLLRLPIPPTMLHTGGLLRAVSSMQSYKCAPVAYCVSLGGLQLFDVVCKRPQQ